MILIRAINMGTIECPLLAPERAIPDNAVSVICDGVNYIVCETGDLPETGHDTKESTHGRS